MILFQVLFIKNRMALAKSLDCSGPPAPQLQNKNAGLITLGTVITKTLGLYKRNKNSQILKRMRAKSMTKLYQLGKIRIKLSKTCAPVSKADVFTKNLHLLTTYGDGGMGDGCDSVCS